MNKIRLIILLSTVLFSCNEDNLDYREKYIGNYSFIITKYTWIQPPNDSISGSFYDTVFSIGIIDKYSNDKLKIIFKNEFIEPNIQCNSFPINIHGLIYPTINIDGTLEYDEITNCGSVFGFQGKFIQSDSIFFTFGGEVLTEKEEIKISGKKIVGRLPIE